MRTLGPRPTGPRRSDGHRSDAAGDRRGPKLHQCPDVDGQPHYYGQFTDTGGLSKGNKVHIAGVDVGKVEGLKIDGDHIAIRFNAGSERFGTESRLAVKTDTILGKKVLELEPRGNQMLRPGGDVAGRESTTPYQIYDAFFDVTKAAQGWDIDTVKQSCTCCRRPSTRPIRT